MPDAAVKATVPESIESMNIYVAGQRVAAMPSCCLHTAELPAEVSRICDILPPCAHYD